MSIGYDPKDAETARQALKVQKLIISGLDFQMYSVTASPAVTILSNTLANPTVVTTSGPHGLSSGQQVTITGSNSTPSINGSHVVTVISPTTFSIAVNVSVAGTAGSFTTANLLVSILEPVKQVYKASLKVDASNSVYQFNQANIAIVDSQGGLSGYNFATMKQVSDQGVIQLSGLPEASIQPNDVIVIEYKVQEDLNTGP